MRWRATTAGDGRTSVRSEICLCGGLITAPSLDESAPYIEAHNASLLHRVWRWCNDYRVPRRPTAGETPVDFVQGDTGASASEDAV